MVHHCAGQGVETDKVCDSSWLVGVLHHIGLDDVLLWDEPVEDVCGGEDWSQVELLQITVEQHGDGLHVRRLELPDARGLGGVGQFVQFEMSLHGHVPRQVTELHLDQLLGVPVVNVPVAVLVELRARLL